MQSSSSPSSVPFVTNAGLIREIARFVTECGYTEAAMKQFGLTKIPWRGSPIPPLLGYKIPDNPRLAILARLFHFGEVLEAQAVSSILPPDIVEKMAACGMLRREGNFLAPECMLTHFGELILASDSVRRHQTSEGADLVLGVNSATQVFARCLILRSNSEVLDLGTGCGTLALMLSPSSLLVQASDINPRAVAFTEFNAVFNGMANIVVKCGDRFEAVQNESFDLIACNPPFFLSPKPRLMYTDNPFELDSMVEGLARTAPKLLKPMGFYQMLCEWVECDGEPCQERLAGWFRKSGCDVLVLKTYEITPVNYTLKRVEELAYMYPEEKEDSLRARMEYFDRKHVKKIYGGLVTMRRRSGKNWIVFEDMDAPTEPIGSILLERFNTLDVLTNDEEGALQRTRPRVSKGVRLMREDVSEAGAWTKTRMFLDRPGSLSKRLRVDSEVAELIGRFDGNETLETIVSNIASERKVPATKVADPVLEAVTTLASRGFVEFLNE